MSYFSKPGLQKQSLIPPQQWVNPVICMWLGPVVRTMTKIDSVELESFWLLLPKDSRGGCYHRVEESTEFLTKEKAQG